MTVAGMDRRIRKLESAISGGIAALTYDELCVRIFELSKIAVEDETFEPEERERWEKLVAEIEADIIHTAASHANPKYQNHWEWVRSMWRKRTGQDDYIPALTRIGESGWDTPNLIERRVALRSSPVVQELLARVS